MSGSHRGRKVPRSWCVPLKCRHWSSCGAFRPLLGRLRKNLRVISTPRPHFDEQLRGLAYHCFGALQQSPERLGGVLVKNQRFKRVSYRRHRCCSPDLNIRHARVSGKIGQSAGAQHRLSIRAIKFRQFRNKLAVLKPTSAVNEHVLKSSAHCSHPSGPTDAITSLNFA